MQAEGVSLALIAPPLTDSQQQVTPGQQEPSGFQSDSVGGGLGSASECYCLHPQATEVSRSPWSSVDFRPTSFRGGLPRVFLAQHACISNLERGKTSRTAAGNVQRMIKIQAENPRAYLCF